MNILCKTGMGVVFLSLWGMVPSLQARQAKLDVSLAHPTLLAGASQTTYLKVGLTGFEPSPGDKRVPVNVAIVLDKSGSMTGTKIAKAKQAAIQAIERLSSEDIVSVIAYDTTVQVVVPATRLTDKAETQAAIRAIAAGGNTALFAGVSKGAAEVRKFIDRNRVNRVILLSDGLANVGPSTPGDLGDLGASLMKEGIAVTTLGLGLDYNEDLLVELARRSDGHHVFIEEAADLAAVFEYEFNEVLSVVAQEVTMTIRCAPGVRPVRLLGLDGVIIGREVIVQLNQLYSQQEKYVLVEIAVPESRAMQVQPVAEVVATYANMETRTIDRLSGSISVHFDESESVVQELTNTKVMAECVLQIANERNKEAMILRDEGKTEQAKAVLELNATYLYHNAQVLESEKLQQRAVDNRVQSESLDKDEWKRTRKAMQFQQYQDTQQQKPN